MTGFAGKPIAFEDVKVGQSVQVTETWAHDGVEPQGTVLVSTTVHVGVVSNVDEYGFGLNNGWVYFSGELEDDDAELDILLLEDVAPEPLAPGYYLTEGEGYFTAIRYWNGSQWTWNPVSDFTFAFTPEFTVLSDRIEIKELTA